MFSMIYRKFKKFIKLMKHEHLAKKEKSRFVWALNESKFLKLNEVRKLGRYCDKIRKVALRSGKATPVRDWFMIELGLNAGMRVSEMRDLKCSDLHLQIEQSSLSVRKGKGNKPRSIRISEYFKKECRWYLEWLEKHRQGFWDAAVAAVLCRNRKDLSLPAFRARPPQ